MMAVGVDNFVSVVTCRSESIEAKSLPVAWCNEFVISISFNYFVAATTESSHTKIDHWCWLAQ